MVRVGLFGAFEGADALVAAVLRAELATRLPGVELRVLHAATGGPTGVGQTERVEWIDQALARRARSGRKLAATLDAVVIAGTVDCHPDRRAPGSAPRGGLGRFEVEVPVAWFGVAPIGEVASVRVAL